MKYLYSILFISMCLLQWAMPLNMILEQETVLEEGTYYKFKTAPIDPSDPFRGKYITLRFNGESVKVGHYDEWVNVTNAYAILGQDSVGFAKVTALLKEPPSTGDYLLVEVNYVNNSSIPSVKFSYPFKRFYLEESKASEAEKIYWEAQRDSAHVAYALVKVRNGKASLEDVRINDKSIVDIVREINNNNQ